MVASVFSKSPRRGTAGFQGKRLGKTHIGELFFKERVLKLPSPWPSRFRIAIGERHLRLLITSLIVLFLLMLGSSLLVQLTDSRTTHVAEQNRLSALQRAARGAEASRRTCRQHWPQGIRRRC